MYIYKTEGEDEISFDPGDIIENIEEVCQSKVCGITLGCVNKGILSLKYVSTF